MKETDIEHLAKKIYNQAEATPPSGVWNRIRAAISAEASTTSANRKWKIYTMFAAGIVACVVIVIAAVTNRSNDTLVQDSLPVASLVKEQQLMVYDGTPVVEETSNAATYFTPRQHNITSNKAKANTTAESQQTTLCHTEGPTAVHNANKEQQTKAITTPQTTTQETISESVATTSDRHDNITLPGSGNAASIDRKLLTSTNARTQPEGRTADTRMASPNSNEIASAVATSRSATSGALPQPRISNLLTPNGDGINDYFEIENLEQYCPVQVEIYTARGKRVYLSDNYQNDFDAAGLPQGNYFYTVTFRTPKPYIRRGIMVVRR